MRFPMALPQDFQPFKPPPTDETIEFDSESTESSSPYSGRRRLQNLLLIQRVAMLCAILPWIMTYFFLDFRIFPSKHSLPHSIFQHVFWTIVITSVVILIVTKAPTIRLRRVIQIESDSKRPRSFSSTDESLKPWDRAASVAWTVLSMAFIAPMMLTVLDEFGTVRVDETSRSYWLFQTFVTIGFLGPGIALMVIKLCSWWIRWR